MTGSLHSFIIQQNFKKKILPMACLSVVDPVNIDCPADICCSIVVCCGIDICEVVQISGIDICGAVAICVNAGSGGAVATSDAVDICGKADICDTKENKKINLFLNIYI